MNKLMLASTLAAFTLASGVASAAVLTNTDKADVTVKVDIAGKHETVTLKENASFDTKGKDASFTIGKEKPFTAKADSNLVVSGGKIGELVNAKTEVKATAPVVAPTAEVKGDVKVETIAPAAGAATTIQLKN